ncbi:MAG: 23S rRNA (guanosine(2251)-2'-O)-methyltransferase RlmB [Azospirillaceae bacterium]
MSRPPRSRPPGPRSPARSPAGPAPSGPRGAKGRPPTRAGKPPRSADRAPGGARRPASARGDERLLYGLHAVAEAWANPERVCRSLRATDRALEALAPALARARAQGLARPEPEVVERERLDRLTGDAVHQGVVVEVEPLPPVDLDDLGRAAEVDGRCLALVLDRVTDPHNVGAILRSATVFGARAVIVPDRHAPPITATLAKTASGAVEHVWLIRVTNLAKALEALKTWGFRVVGLAEEAEATLAEVELGARTALVLGAEGEGLRRLTRDTCDALARLPTGGPIGSLNVSNAAAVALYEAVRRAPG